MIIETCCEKEYNLLGKIKVNIIVEKNSYDLPIDCLFEMAYRKNKRRSFLFVSKVLGKHISVIPGYGLLIGKLLALTYLNSVYDIKIETTDIVETIIRNKKNNELYLKYQENRYPLPEKSIFVGFAETATALGHSVFSSFKNNNYYIHTTRENIIDIENSIEFCEEHSHAVNHKLYFLNDKIIKTDYPVIFIDDEITTGKTTLNIIRAIHAKYPRENYTILSLLDWRNNKDRKKYKEVEEELGININTISLLSGNIEIEKQGAKFREKVDVDNIDFRTEDSLAVNYLYLDKYFKNKVNVFSQGFANVPYLKNTGRFGISFTEEKALLTISEQIAAYLKKYRNGKTLCLGTGEFMYIPMLISLFMGENIFFQSTTRSPIYHSNEENYGVKNVYKFISPDDNKLENFFYNVDYGDYDDIFIFFEREKDKNNLSSFLNQIKKLGIANIFLVFCSKKQDKGILEQEKVVKWFCQY